MNEDVSKNTILVLVILTIIISLLGTLTVLNEASKINVNGQATTTVTNPTPPAAGKVSLTITPRPVTTTGKVTLTIVQNT